MSRNAFWLAGVLYFSTASAAVCAENSAEHYVQRTHHLEGVASAPAETLWKAFTDWGGVMKWFNAAPEKPYVRLIECPLLPAQKESDLPRTRRCRPDLSTFTSLPPEVKDPNFKVPELVDEHLLHQDDESMYAVYSYDRAFHPGTTSVQVVSEGPCRSRFIIKYVVLEKATANASKEPEPVGDAFALKQDYRGLKYYSENMAKGISACR